MRILTKRLMNIEKQYQRANVFRLVMRDGTSQRLPVADACTLILNNPGAVTDVTAPEGQDNGILPELLKAVVADGAES